MSPRPERPYDGPPLDPGRLVEVLERHEVDYVLVGGSAAVLYGAQRQTRDVDCVARRDAENLERLAGAMRELNARLAVEGLTDEEAKLLPVQVDAQGLAPMEISTWTTDAGRLDILREIPNREGQPQTFEELIPNATHVDRFGTTVKLAALGDIIASKEWADRPKDREALDELRMLRDASEAADLAGRCHPHAPSTGASPAAEPGAVDRPAPGVDRGDDLSR